MPSKKLAWNIAVHGLLGVGALMLMGMRGCKHHDTADAGTDEGPIMGGETVDAGSTASDGGAGQGGSQGDGDPRDGGGAVDAGSFPVDGGPSCEPGCVGDACGGPGDAGVADGGGSEVLLCGTRGGVQCDDGEFCNHPPEAQCGELDAGGVCTPLPEACLQIYQPVCGCDNRTYGNDCAAASQGVSVRHTGACTASECEAAGGTPRYSDGASIPTCAAGQEQYELGGGDQPLDEPAVCCLPGEVGGVTCGGIANLPCEDGEFCNYEPEVGGLGCGPEIADASGVCQEQPQGCTREYQPVCGCDRRSYGNRCEAHAAGVSVLREQLCTELDCEAVGGHAVNGFGPPAVCPEGETDYGPIRYSNGMIAIEGTLCCIPK